MTDPKSDLQFKVDKRVILPRLAFRWIIGLVSIGAFSGLAWYYGKLGFLLVPLVSTVLIALDSYFVLQCRSFTLGDKVYRSAGREIRFDHIQNLQLCRRGLWVTYSEGQYSRKHLSPLGLIDPQSRDDLLKQLAERIRAHQA